MCSIYFVRFIKRVNTVFNIYLKTVQNKETINDISSLILQKYSLTSKLTLVGISGAAALGKSSLALALKNNILFTTEKDVEILPTDAFLLNRKERHSKKISGYNPNATNILELYKCVKDLLRGKNVSFYPYDHGTGNFLEHLVTLKPSDILIIDGIHSLHSRLRDLISLKIFLNTNREIAIKLRSTIDSSQRGYSKHSALSAAYLEQNNYDLYVHPYSEFADVIVQVHDNWIYEIIT